MNIRGSGHGSGSHSHSGSHLHGGASPGGGSPTDALDSPALQSLQAQIDRLTQLHEDMTQHIRHLDSKYQGVLSEMVNFQRNMAQQDGLLQNLIQYFLQLENGG